MNFAYKTLMRIGILLTLIVLASIFNVTHWLFYGFLAFNIIKFTIKKNWKGMRKYAIFLACLFLFRYLGIPFIFFILGMLLYPLIINKNFPTIIKHPILSYELCIRQIQLLWLNLISNNKDFGPDGWFKRSSVFCKNRIREIKDRGVDFDFVETKI